MNKTANKELHKHYVLKYGNRQWLANEGAHLKIDFINPTTDTIQMKCVYDSTVGICDKMIECKVLNEKLAEKKLIIIKHRRRHNSESKMGFRAKYTLIKVGGNI